MIVLSFPALSSRNDHLRFSVFFFLDKIAISTHLDFAVLIPKYIDSRQSECTTLYFVLQSECTTLYFVLQSECTTLYFAPCSSCKRLYVQEKDSVELPNIWQREYSPFWSRTTWSFCKWNRNCVKSGTSFRPICSYRHNTSRHAFLIRWLTLPISYSIKCKFNPEGAWVFKMIIVIKWCTICLFIYFFSFQRMSDRLQNFRAQGA